MVYEARHLPARASGLSDLIASIRETAPLARYVRVKFYHPSLDGHEPTIPYDQIFDILLGLHYPSFLDIVYEPARPGGEDVRTALPHIVSFLRTRISLQLPQFRSRP